MSDKDKYALTREGFELDAFSGSNERKIENTIKSNSFDVDIDAPIYRIFQLEFFLQDLRNQTLTYCKPDPDAWGDEYEAFLSRVKFFISGLESYLDPDSVKQFPLTIKPALDNFFALCWTRRQSESKLAWDDFSYGNESIRLQTTPRKLLTSAIDVNDKFYNLSHFLGGVHYMLDNEFEELFTTTPYEQHLDSLGVGLARSFLILGESFEHEEEVRLLYAHHPKDNAWVEGNVTNSGNLCTIPFDWKEVIEGIVLCPSGLCEESFSALRRGLERARVSVSPQPSIFSDQI